MCIFSILFRFLIRKTREREKKKYCAIIYVCHSVGGVASAAAIALDVVDHGCFGFSLILPNDLYWFFGSCSSTNSRWCSTGQRPKTINKYKNKSTAVDSANVENVLFIFCEPKTHTHTDSQERDGAWHCGADIGTQMNTKNAHTHMPNKEQIQQKHINSPAICCDCTSRPIKQIYFTINNKSLKIFSICAII